MIYNSLITLRLCGFPFVEIGVVSPDVVHGQLAPSVVGALAGRSGGAEPVPDDRVVA